MIVFEDPLIIVSIIIFFINLLIGFLVFQDAPKKNINRVFTLFVLASALWVGALILFSSPNKEMAIWGSRLAFVGASFIAVFLFYFAYSFPEGRKLPTLVQYLLYSLASIISIASLTTELVVTDLIPQASGISYSSVYGPIYKVFFVFFIVLTLLALILLINKYRISTEKHQRKQIRIVFIGIATALAIGTTTNLLIPSLTGNSEYSRLGQLSVTALLISLAYAILRLEFLNFKIIATELLASGLWLFILLRTLLADDNKERLENLGLFIVTVIFGILLIRSVRKEVTQREQLAVANKQLERLNLEKSEFLSIATHQLKAPLAVIRGYASMLNEGSYGQIGEKAKEVLSRIYDSATNLVVVIDDYLNVSRIDQGRMQYQFGPTDIEKMVRTIADDMRQTAGHSKIDLSLEVEPRESYTVNADVGKIRQVITNLVDNAIKYTNEGGKIKLSLARPDDEHVRIAIKDNGIGMSPETIRKLFRRFSRAKDIGKTERAGTGLGLYIAREMVRAHGGRIWAESEGEGKGSAFFVELPNDAPEESKEKQRDSADAVRGAGKQ